jgi:DNA-binding Xre family transcriptional regulator
MNHLSCYFAELLDKAAIYLYNQNMCSNISTIGRITILLGKQQAATGERMSPRKLAEKAGVPKDFVYRLDAGQARHVDLDALARLCAVLNCNVQDILVWEREHGESV